MGSLNYGAFGPKFNLQGMFRVLRMKSLPSGNLYYDEVAECGVSTDSNELKALIATAQTLQIVDFGNGLLGIYAEGKELHFCVVPELRESRTDQQPTPFESSDQEDIF
jgi:hypothetical protein